MKFSYHHDHSSHQLIKMVLSIVAVHGLGAHPEFTWTTLCEEVLHGAQSCPHTHDASQKHRLNWLKDDGFLPTDFKSARIMTFGYNADWFLRAPEATATDRAGALLRALKRWGAGNGVR